MDTLEEAYFLERGVAWNAKDYKRYSREFKLEAWILKRERSGASRPAPIADEDLGLLPRENAKLREENEISEKPPPWSAAAQTNGNTVPTLAAALGQRP